MRIRQPISAQLNRDLTLLCSVGPLLILMLISLKPVRHEPKHPEQDLRIRGSNQPHQMTKHDF